MRHRSRFYLVHAVITCGILLSSAEARAERMMDKSSVTLPRSAGRFHLESTEFDPAKPMAGALTIYSYAGAPRHVEIHVQLMPYGLAPPKEDVAGKVAESFERGVQKSTSMQPVKPGARSAVRTSKPPSFVAGTPTPDERVDAVDGVRQAFSLNYDGRPSTMVESTFYRSMFLVRTTVLGPGDAMSTADYLALADEVNKTILPPIEIRNFGLCGDTYAMTAKLRRPQDKDEMRAIIEAGALAVVANCAKTESGPYPAAPPGQVYRFDYSKAVTAGG